ncbi:MAG: peptidylprolyl isomerase [Candidatus Dormiibacterota bacterium]
MKPPTSPRRLPFVIAATVVLVVAAVAGAVALDQADGPRPVGAVAPTPTPTATPSPTPTPTIIPYADCASATFGSPLGPLNPPSDVHVYSAAPAMTIDQSKLYEATIETSKGNIVICLQPDLAPVTVNNFVTLVRNGFYNGIPFARVVSGFVIQGGDPDCIGNVPSAPATPSGTCGQGGPGYQFDDEPVHEKYIAGAVAMANGGPNTNGSQFFICIADDTSSLALSYNLFGQVVSGLSVAQSIVQGDVMEQVTVTEQT